MARAAVAPPTSNLLHLIGDTHFGATTAQRFNKVLADLAYCPTPTAHIQIGDSINDNTAGQDATAKAWFDANLLPTAPYYTIVGNHDIWQNFRTADAWAAVWGYADQNYTVDWPFARGIFIGPDTMVKYPADTTTMQFTAATQTYLDTQLSGTTKDCLIFCHAPLINTVVGPTTGSTDLVWSSAESGFGQLDSGGTTDTAIRTILGNHTNAKAWISGHTHSPITAPGFVKSLTVGSHVIACINCSAIFYTGRTQEWNDPICSLYLNHTPGVKIDVRVRDHGAGSWVGIRGSRVQTVTF